MIVFLALTSALFVYNEAEFFATSKKQMAEGYTWQRIECRAAQHYPSIRFNDQKICYKLQK